MARPAHRRGNLPAEVTSFVGRRRGLAEVRAKLANARLVSLVGPGGVGKTRLAIRAAANLGRGFPGGAWLVELADVRESGLVANAAMAALDLRDQTATEPRALLLSYLRDQRLLLVVDNCEHLRAAAAGFLTAVLRAAPGVRVITTSREPLGVPGEQLIYVPPLDVPPVDPPERLTRLRQNDAVALFVDRASAGSGGFELTGENQAAVVELCRRLDGLPLAIELAAVRIRVLSAQQILDRLTDRFALLTAGDSAALPRHQTLRTAIDWSHDLLPPHGQVLLRRLSVFAGRFTLDDIEGVCAPGDMPAPQVLDVLSSLVDKSLVVKEDAKAVACYRLHETMREYAGLKLREAGEEAAVEQRCADHYRSRCMQSLSEARYRLVEWLDWMQLEIDNIRAVLLRCVAGQDHGRGLDLASYVGWYWITRATTEGVRWLDELIGANPRAPAHAYFMRGFLAVLQYDPAAALPALERAATAADHAGLASLRSLSLSMGSIAAHMAGDHPAAKSLLDTAQLVAEGLDDFPATIGVLQARALNGLFEGDVGTVRSAAAEGVRRSREVGDLYSLDMMLLNLGCAALVGGDLDEVEPLLTEALQLARRLDDRVAQYVLLDALGCYAAACGQPRRAARLLGAARTARTSAGANVLPHLESLVAQATESTTAALGDAAFRTEYDTGRHLGREAAIALALGEPARTATAASTDREPSPLGKREAEVARLVAEGLSNKQIGARLLISGHTVDTHIRSILNKLGFNSRAQIAAWMASADR